MNIVHCVCERNLENLILSVENEIEHEKRARVVPMLVIHAKPPLRLFAARVLNLIMYGVFFC